MNCPHCGLPLHYADCVSQCMQKVSLDPDGKVIDYSSVEEIFGVNTYRCPGCQGDITKSVKE
jgi:hypothetical protein